MVCYNDIFFFVWCYVVRGFECFFLLIVLFKSKFEIVMFVEDFNIMVFRVIYNDVIECIDMDVVGIIELLDGWKWVFKVK